MGLFDRAKEAAKDAVSKNSGAVGGGLDKAADAIDQRTGGKYSEKISQGVDAAKGRLGVEDETEPDGERSPEDAAGAEGQAGEDRRDDEGEGSGRR